MTHDDFAIAVACFAMLLGGIVVILTGPRSVGARLVLGMLVVGTVGNGLYYGGHALGFGEAGERIEGGR